MNEPERDIDLIKSARADMRAGRFEAALAVLAPACASEPANAEALYMSAVCARYLKRFDEAGALLSQLTAAAPDFGRAWQEAGHLARDTGDVPRALTAYQRACQYNPALEASWRAQADLLARAGQAQEAEAALAQAERLKALPRELVTVTHLLSEGKLLKAENLCRAFLKQHPTHVEGMRLLAEIAVRFGILEDAEILLENAVEFEPDNIQLRLDYIQTLRKRQKFAAALREAEALSAREPGNPVFTSHLAIEKMQTGDYETAVALFNTVLEKLPADPATLTSRGHALKTWGKQAEAIESYRAACRARPTQGDAWYALANLKTYEFSDADIAEMKAREVGADSGPNDRVHFCFALGKALEDRGEIAESFAYYVRGNDLKRAQSRYTSEGMEAEFAAQKEVCTSALFERQAGKGDPAPDPIFILGLPRAGSTLIEQILASHSQVDGTLELPNILALSQRLRGRDRASGGAYPGILHDLTAGQLAELGRDYIETTRIHRAGAPFFTDKMPNNFRHIGLIHLILPNAKIIDARREPMACCFSGFKQLFAEGQEFTYGLDEIGRYYRGYVDLMEHWDAVLPGKVLRVQHEDLVADLEGQVRRILDYCGLEFEPACLEFHKTERAVRTASSEQVRQPINTRGLDAWQKFEPHLGPLKAALGPELAP
ncbi:MAG: sulfotransferase [Hyphomonadaceae bacterium]|nr:sulfotransferase [Hyphomonadaceae bacterium]